MNARGRVVLAILAGALFASAILGPAVLTGRGDAVGTHPRKHGGRARRTSAPPGQVYVCRNPFYAPQALGGEQCYGSEADFGPTPLAAPKALMCETSLTGVRHKVISIQVLYKRRPSIPALVRSPA
jgi:hypothetical protein